MLHGLGGRLPGPSPVPTRAQEEGPGVGDGLQHAGTLSCMVGGHPDMQCFNNEGAHSVPGPVPDPESKQRTVEMKSPAW